MTQCCLHISTDVPGGLLPDEVIQGSGEEKRGWLHRTLAEVIDSFAMFKDLDVAHGVREPSEKAQFPCRAAGCETYSKSRSKREKNTHALTHDAPMTESSTLSASDHGNQHSEAKLGFGLFLASMQDAIKEGGGERLMHLYRVALLYYKAYGHTHYTYAVHCFSLCSSMPPCHLGWHIH